MVATVNSLFKLTVGPSRHEKPTVRKALTVATHSPAPPQGSKEQFTDRDEGKSCDATFHVAEIRLAARVARHHQIGEYIRIEKDNA